MKLDGGSRLLRSLLGTKLASEVKWGSFSKRSSNSLSSNSFWNWSGDRWLSYWSNYSCGCCLHTTELNAYCSVCLESLELLGSNFNIFLISKFLMNWTLFWLSMKLSSYRLFGNWRNCWFCWSKCIGGLLFWLSRSAGLMLLLFI